MESPAKKLDFGKENKPLDAADLSALEAQMDAKHSQSKSPSQELKTVAPTIKPEEADEPLLQENPQRFVLFPIKYDEVRDATHSTRSTLRVR